MRLRYQLLIFMFLRTILNTMHRMVYPFLAVFARGLGVDLTTFSFAITARSLVGALSPTLAPIADRRGRKFGLLAGAFSFTLGMSLVAIFPNIVTFSAAMVLAIIGKYLFDPAMQAYFGDRVPYGQRGAALAVTEFSWSLAFIAGIPLVGWLINRYGWTAPFPLLAGLGFGMLLVLWRMIPHEDPHHVRTSDSRANFRAVLTNIPALAGISVALWASASNELINLIFGVWLEDSFGLKIAALAGASAVIGISELSGEGLVALTTDRLGKPRALVIGLVGNAVSALALPFIGTTPIGALIGLFFYYITFEYIMVSHIPLMSELVPKARATLLSFNITGHSLGRAIGASLSTLIYTRFGFLPIVFVSVLFNIFALLALGELTQKVVILPRIVAMAKRFTGIPARD
ncbi:MAG: MFS transporter [Anaerolineales bacterium]|nr:MFS transporter [Anaerolineales bacterium]